MHNKKVNEVAEDKITSDMFENKKSYNLFIKAFRWMVELQNLKDSGHILLENGEFIGDDFMISFERDGKMPSIGTGGDNYLCCWVGSTIGNKENTVYVYANELDIFKSLSIIAPQYAKKWNPQ